MNLISLKSEGEVVFVGDTHGDLEASQDVIQRYFKPRTKICFLGDYVDRSPYSKENVEFLWKQKEKTPEQIYLLKGNHETYCIKDFFPADFWLDLNETEKQEYSKLFSPLPLAISVGNIIAMHGALPEISNLEEIEGIKQEDQNWKNIVWGDFIPNLDADGNGIYGGTRSRFGEKYFKGIMEKIGKEVLIRSHDPEAEMKMFNNKCLTLFTSCAYGIKRVVAIADFDKHPEIKSIDDLLIEVV